MSKETLEEAAEDWYNKEGLMKPSKVEIRAWVKGAKWMQERMYSEEDMEKAFQNGLNRSFDSDFDRWIEQFKKKQHEA